MAKKASPVKRAVKKPAEKQKVKNKVPRLRTDANRQIQIQKALYEIADAASAVTDMQSFYKRLHEIVGGLMYAENFIIMLIDEATNTRSYPYYSDSAGDVAPPTSPIPEHSLLAELIRHPRTLHYNRQQNEKAIPRGEMFGTPSEDFVGVPFKMGNQVIGGIIVQSYIKELAYSDEDVSILEFVAQHIAVALTRARAIEETRQRNAELQIINSVQEGLASKLDMQAIYELVGEKIRTTFNAQVVSIDTYNRAIQLLHSRYYFEDGRTLPGTTYAVFGFRKHVIENCQPIVINRDMQRWMEEYDNPVNLGSQPKSAIFIPMIAGNEAMGVISLQNNDQENAFSKSDIQLLGTLANSMVIALENARLFDETQRLLKETEQRNAELAIINSVQAALAAELNMQGIYDAVGDKIREIFDQADIGIRIYDPKNKVYYFPYEYSNGKRVTIDPVTHLNPEDVLAATGFVPHVFRTRETLVINENMPQEVERFGSSVLPGTQMEKSAVYVPLLIGDQARGVIVMMDTEHEHAFGDSDVRLLETLANSMSVALENARLFDETQRLFKETEQRNAELAIINSVQEGLASKLDFQEIIELVGATIETVFSADVVGIFLYDRKNNLIEFPYVRDHGERYYHESRSPYGVFEYMLKAPRPFLIHTYAEMGRFQAEYSQDNLGGPTEDNSFIVVPLLSGSQVIGMVSVGKLPENAFTESDLRLLQTIANSMSVALENARLFDETQRLLKETEQRNAELAIINSVQEGLASKLEMQAIYDLVGDKLRQIFAADTIFIVYHDKENNLLVAPYYADKNLRRSFSRPYGSGVAEAIIDSGKPLLLGTEQEQENYRAHHVISPGAGKDLNQSVLGAPIFTKGQAYGAVSVQSYKVHAFTENDLRLLQTLTNSMSIALENARLWEQEKMFRKALQRELEIGREIQAGFLPEALPQVEGWEIAALLMSAREVAGDFYDAFELPDGSIGLVIADVCDKGVGAALFMTLFRSLIRATANREYFEHTENPDSPQSTAERLKRAVSLTNNYIAETHGESGMFATLFFGILDPHNGRLAYINGGHEPPLILQSGSVRELLRKTGSAVGAIKDCHFDLVETQLQAGDMFFAFTDGVPDCKNPRGEFYGRKHLLDVLQNERDSSQELVNAIEADLRQYISGATQFDDITLLAVRRVG